VAYGQGLAQLGQGVASVGDNMFKLAEMQARSINIKRVAENERLLAHTQALIETDQAKEPDETKWGEIAQKHISGLPELPSDLSDDARDQITARRSVWSQSAIDSTMVSSAKKSVRDADSDLKDAQQLAILRNDLPLANKLTEERGANGALSTQGVELEKEHNRLGVEQVQKKARAVEMDAFRNQTLELAKTAPPKDVRKWIEGDYGGLNLAPDEKEYLLEAARRQERQQTNEVSDDFGARLANGDLWNDYEIEATYGASPFVTPDGLEHMKQQAAKYRGLQDVQKREGEAGTRAFYEAYGDAQQWAPDLTTPEGQEAAAKELVSRKAWVATNVRGDLQGMVNQVLARKFGTAGSKQTKPEPTAPQKVIQQRIATMFTPKVTKAKSVYDDLVGDDPFNPRTPADDPRMIAAQKRMDDTVTDQFNLDKQMDEFFKKKPDASETEAVSHMQGLLSEPDMINFLESNFGARGDTGPTGSAGTPIYFQGGKITSYGYSNDETPDSNSSAGVGSFVPDSEEQKIKSGQSSTYKLREGDLAVSPDVEESFRENGIRPGQWVTITYADGSKHTGRWMDRTANDEQAAKLGLKKLRGRFDIYSPKGKHSRDGSKVVSYAPAS